MCFVASRDKICQHAGATQISDRCPGSDPQSRSKKMPFGQSKTLHSGHPKRMRSGQQKHVHSGHQKKCVPGNKNKCIPGTQKNAFRASKKSAFRATKIVRPGHPKIDVRSHFLFDFRPEFCSVLVRFLFGFGPLFFELWGPHFQCFVKLSQKHTQTHWFFHLYLIPCECWEKRCVDPPQKIQKPVNFFSVSRTFFVRFPHIFFPVARTFFFNSAWKNIDQHGDQFHVSSRFRDSDPQSGGTFTDNALRCNLTCSVPLLSPAFGRDLVPARQTSSKVEGEKKGDFENRKAPVLKIATHCIKKNDVQEKTYGPPPPSTPPRLWFAALGGHKKLSKEARSTDITRAGARVPEITRRPRG